MDKQDAKPEGPVPVEESSLSSVAGGTELDALKRALANGVVVGDVPPSPGPSPIPVNEGCSGK
jgi:hypothetical protein